MKTISDVLVGLNCCAESRSCTACPYYGYKELDSISMCTSKLAMDALRLLNMQYKIIKQHHESDGFWDALERDWN